MTTAAQIAKKAETDRAAAEIITAQAKARDEKTARLRAARLASEIVSAVAPAQHRE